MILIVVMLYIYISLYIYVYLVIYLCLHLYIFNIYHIRSGAFIILLILFVLYRQRLIEYNSILGKLIHSSIDRAQGYIGYRRLRINYLPSSRAFPTSPQAHCILGMLRYTHIARWYCKYLYVIMQLPMSFQVRNENNETKIH